MKKQSRKRQPRNDDPLDMMLFAPENDEALDKLLGGGWGDIDLPGFDLDDLGPFDFECLGTELSRDVAS